MTVSQQSIVFLYCIVCGAVLGLAFDLFRVFRRLTPAGKTATNVQDILYWCLASLVAFAFVLQCNAGEIRWYMLLGVLLGAYFYFITISSLLIRFLVAAVRLFEKVIAWVTKVLLMPLRFLLKLMRKPFFLVIRVGKRGGKRFLSKLNENMLFLRKFLKKV